mgnify:CR=1 FL=1
MENNVKVKAERETKKFMKDVNSYLARKAGGKVPPEWACSCRLLGEYYKQFITLTTLIESLDDYFVPSKYGNVLNPLFGARDAAARRLERLMVQMGMTLKEASRMDMIDVAEEDDSPLATFLTGKDKIEKR